VYNSITSNHATCISKLMPKLRNLEHLDSGMSLLSKMKEISGGGKMEDKIDKLKWSFTEWL
jgi:hypothetical protein